MAIALWGFCAVHAVLHFHAIWNYNKRHDKSWQITYDRQRENHKEEMNYLVNINDTLFSYIKRIEKELNALKTDLQKGEG